MIELKHLRTLQALRNSGSLAAASQLHQTQSALSHQFSDLEQRLGFRLFVRKSQPLRFTPQGEILLQLAEQILLQVQQALQTCQQPHQATLRLAIECHSCIQWLTPALAEFHQQWPQVLMDFRSGVTFDPQPALQQSELDLVLTSDILPRSELYYAPMFDFEVWLVVSPDHPLAAKEIIAPQDLDQKTLLIYPVQRNRMDIWRHFLQPAGISPMLKTVDNTLLLIQMVSARMGIAALPHWVVESFERRGLSPPGRLAKGCGAVSILPYATANSASRQPRRSSARRSNTPTPICPISAAPKQTYSLLARRGNRRPKPHLTLGISILGEAQPGQYASPCVYPLPIHAINLTARSPWRSGAADFSLSLRQRGSGTDPKARLITW